MMTAVSLTAGAVALGVLCLALRPVVREYLQFRGTRRYPVRARKSSQASD